jgi:hypothetical protein
MLRLEGLLDTPESVEFHLDPPYKRTMVTSFQAPPTQDREKNILNRADKKKSPHSKSRGI